MSLEMVLPLGWAELQRRAARRERLRNIGTALFLLAAAGVTALELIFWGVS